jgi:hypothetical protein
MSKPELCDQGAAWKTSQLGYDEHGHREFETYLAEYKLSHGLSVFGNTFQQQQSPQVETNFSKHLQMQTTE